MMKPKTNLLTVLSSKALTISTSIGKPYSPWTETFMPVGIIMSGHYLLTIQGSDSTDSLTLTLLDVLSMRSFSEELKPSTTRMLFTHVKLMSILEELN
jgi:hypothetical protein